MILDFCPPDRNLFYSFCTGQNFPVTDLKKGHDFKRDRRLVLSADIYAVPGKNSFSHTFQTEKMYFYGTALFLQRLYVICQSPSVHGVSVRYLYIGF